MQSGARITPGEGSKADKELGDKRQGGKYLLLAVG